MASFFGTVWFILLEGVVCLLVGAVGGYRVGSGRWPWSKSDIGL